MYKHFAAVANVAAVATIIFLLPGGLSYEKKLLLPVFFAPAWKDVQKLYATAWDNRRSSGGLPLKRSVHHSAIIVWYRNLQRRKPILYFPLLLMAPVSDSPCGL